MTVLLSDYPTMARKPQRTPEPDPSARKQLLPVSRISAEMREIQDLCVELQGYLKGATEQGIKSIEIDGATMLRRAKDLIFGFVGKTATGLREARRNQRPSPDGH